MKQITLEGFLEKTKRCIQDHHNSQDGALCGINGFQPLTDLTNKGAIGVFNVPLEYYNVF